MQVTNPTAAPVVVPLDRPLTVGPGETVEVDDALCVERLGPVRPLPSVISMLAPQLVILGLGEPLAAAPPPAEPTVQSYVEEGHPPGVAEVIAAQAARKKARG